MAGAGKYKLGLGLSNTNWSQGPGPGAANNPDFFEINAKIRPKFGVDLYGRIYFESNSINVFYYWKPTFNIIHTKPKCIQFTGKFPKKKGKKHIFHLKQDRRENIKTDKLEKNLRRN